MLLEIEPLVAMESLQPFQMIELNSDPGAPVVVVTKWSIESSSQILSIPPGKS